jgi:hypothetical protein
VNGAVHCGGGPAIKTECQELRGPQPTRPPDAPAVGVRDRLGDLKAHQGTPARTALAHSRRRGARRLRPLCWCITPTALMRQRALDARIGPHRVSFTPADVLSAPAHEPGGSSPTTGPRADQDPGLRSAAHLLRCRPRSNHASLSARRSNEDPQTRPAPRPRPAQASGPPGRPPSWQPSTRTPPAHKPLDDVAARLEARGDLTVRVSKKASPTPSDCRQDRAGTLQSSVATCTGRPRIGCRYGTANTRRSSEERNITAAQSTCWSGL